MCRHLGTSKEFANRVHRALRAWYASETKDTLTDLLLAQQIKTRHPAATPRLITNQILLDGLEQLKLINNDGAALLHRRFLDRETAQEIAHSLNRGIDTIFQLQRAAIDQLAGILWQREEELCEQRRQQIETRLEPQTYSQLFGVTEQLAEIGELFETTTPPWLIALEGLGGIGKTTLATELVRDLTANNFFTDILWVTAKQQEFTFANGLQPLDHPALDVDTLTTTLLDQLGANPDASPSSQAKMSLLTKHLKEAPYLVIVDNLETAIDYQTLLPTLRTLANPTKFLLTSRHSLRHYPDVFCYDLKELSQADTCALLRHEVQNRGISTLLNAPQTELERIYQVVGGNPLALKLIVGQLSIFSLEEVLENLRQARGKKAEELYNYIYWQAWEALDETSQQVLLAMPLAQEGDLVQITALTKIEEAKLGDAIEHLVTLSLLEVGGDVFTRRHYRIHRLTETFLVSEVVGI